MADMSLVCSQLSNCGDCASHAADFYQTCKWCSSSEKCYDWNILPMECSMENSVGSATFCKPSAQSQFMMVAAVLISIFVILFTILIVVNGVRKKLKDRREADEANRMQGFYPIIFTEHGPQVGSRQFPTPLVRTASSPAIPLKHSPERDRVPLITPTSGGILASKHNRDRERERTSPKSLPLFGAAGHTNRPAVGGSGSPSSSGLFLKPPLDRRVSGLNP
eukprot:GILK01013477.1.p1 GENE.GILK01013477.1~~GILK01013477.1.p1  ORF type:complete len:221 (+),score=3.34 GILK01013477.1:37-699(+)